MRTSGMYNNHAKNNPELKQMDVFFDGKWYEVTENYSIYTRRNNGQVKKRDISVDMEHDSFYGTPRIFTDDQDKEYSTYVKLVGIYACEDGRQVGFFHGVNAPQKILDNLRDWGFDFPEPSHD